MKLILHVLIFFTLSISSSLQAQILKDCRLPNSVPNRPGEHDDNGKMHMGDFNGDGFQDIIVPANTSPLAFNDGTGHFNQDFSFSIDEGGYSSSIGDLDGDGDLDLVTLYGFYHANIPATRYLTIYLNDGQGKLIKDPNQSLPGLAMGDMEIVDIDQDGDLDIFHTGVYWPGTMYSYLFMNDGQGAFSLESQEGLVAMCEGDISFEDLNGDGTPDLLFTGMSQRLTEEDTTVFMVPKYYFNDGDGFFTEELNHQLPNAMYSCIGVVDIDLDNDNDLVLLSEEDGYQRQAFLFLNNGSGAFEESIELPVSIPELAHFEFGDIDNDGRTDMVLMGGHDIGTTDEKVVKILINNGDYQFEVKSDHGIKSSYNPQFKLLDIDNNGTLDLVLPFDSGIYYNDGEGNFNTQANWFRNLEESYFKKADLNADGFPDIIHWGRDQTGQAVANLHFNNWTSTFNFHSSIFEGGSYPESIEIINLNQDALPDLVAACPDRATRYFINEGNGFFTEASLDLFEEGYWNHLLAEDLNEDGLKDLILSGRDIDLNTVSKVYKGSGSGQFELVKTLNLSISTLKRLDINGDGLMDFVFKAKEDYSDNNADLYISLGTQSWESVLEQIPSPIGGILALADYHTEIQTIKDSQGEYILYNGSANKERLLKKNIDNTFQSIYSSFADERLLYTGDINMDEIGDYIHIDKDYYGEYYSIVNFLDDEMITIDSILAPQGQFTQTKSYLSEDFDKDGDTDVLILKENGEINYLINQSLQPAELLQPEEESRFLLFPNPVISTKLTIVLDEDWAEVKDYIIYDRLGSVVQQGQLASPADSPYQEIELKKTSTGLYSILIYSKDRKSSQSFFVQQN